MYTFLKNTRIQSYDREFQRRSCKNLQRHALAAWSSGIVSACRAMGHEIKGICRVVAFTFF
jgi:hypothetical protein